MHHSTDRRQAGGSATPVTQRLKLMLIAGVGCLSFAGTRVAVASTLDAEELELADLATPAADIFGRRPTKFLTAIDMRAERVADDAPLAMREPAHVEVHAEAPDLADPITAVTALAADVALAAVPHRSDPSDTPSAGPLFDHTALLAEFGDALSRNTMPDWRALLSRPGVSWSFAQITDASGALGGMAAAQSLRTHSNIAITLDMDSIAGIHGLRIFAQYKSKSGRNGSGEAAFVQNFSNIDADDFHAFGEVWLEQRLMSDRVRVKAGRIDFNTEFAGTDNGANFLNASMGFSPSITAAPTFPLPTAGANLIVAPRASTALSVGIFNGLDGAPAPTDGRSLFQIAQLRQHWALGAAQLSGTLGLGVWHHSGMFSDVSAAPDDEPAIAGTGGWYATIDQQLWQGAPRAAAADQRSVIGAFAQFGRSDPRVQAIRAHEGMGLTFSGFVANRTADVFGLGMTRAIWSDGRELIGEAYYQLPVTSHFSLVADMQHVKRRDVDTGIHTGLVTTLRTIVSF
jgi:porin